MMAAVTRDARRSIATAIVCATGVIAAAVASLRGQERPLPDLQQFLQDARAHLHTDSELLSQYTYLQRSADLHVSIFGKVSTGPVKVFQVYPGVGPNDTYRKLVEVDGRPVPRAEQDKQDRERQKKVLEALDRRAHESARDREKRLERRDKRRREREQVIDDLFRVYAFTMVGRQTLAGRSVIAIDFAPKPYASPVTDEGKLMKKAKGRVWISEDDDQVARVEALMLDDVSVAGFLFKLYKGTTVSFERRKVNDEVWLPAEMRLTGSGRALIRRFRVATVIQYLGLPEVLRPDRHAVLPAEEAGPLTCGRYASRIDSPKSSVRNRERGAPRSRQAASSARSGSSIPSVVN